MQTIDKQEMLLFLKEEAKAAEENKKSMNEKVNKEYFEGVSWANKHAIQFIKNMLKIYHI